MELTVILLGIVLATVIASVLMVINLFAIKEKTYEEVINEQRKQTNALLGGSGKLAADKSRDKKAKKAVKKANKQAAAAVFTETVEESETTVDNHISSSDSVLLHSNKLHVEFEEPDKEATVSANADTNLVNKKKRKKKDKVRPILIHKPVEIPVVLDILEVSPANHFEELHPKDDFELLQSHLHFKEKAVEKEPEIKTEVKPEKVIKKQEAIKEKSVKSKISSENKETKPVSKEKLVKSDSEKSTPSSSSEAAQKVKSSKVANPPVVPNTASDEEEAIVAVAGVVTNGLIAPGKEKKKKKGEANSLMHLVGSKGEEVDLTLLLKAVRNAELSRSELQILIDLLLNKQHEAPNISVEWSEGKADPVQKLKKQLADKEKALQEEQEACASAQAKLREVRAEQRNEMSMLVEKNKKLESMYQSNRSELVSMTNSWHNLNTKMQAMHAQINQDQVTSMKLREEIAELQRQRQQQIDINRGNKQEAESTIQELQSVKNQLSIELTNKQGQVVQLQHQVTNEIGEKDNCIRQFEEIRRDLEHHLALAHRQEGDLQNKLSQINTVCHQKTEEARELKCSLIKVENELANLKEEHSKMNGLTRESEQHKEDLLNLENKLSSVTHELEEVKRTSREEIQISNNSINRLEKELNEQKDKNDELRKKNWKVMDALKTAENKNISESKASANNVPVNLDEEVLKVRLEEQERYKQFILKLFPNIEVPDESCPQKWTELIGAAIEKHINDIGSQEKSHLQEQIQNYKKVIDEMESVLSNLQESASKEETHWHVVLEAKEQEIATLKERHKELNKLISLNGDQKTEEKCVFEAPVSKSVSDVDAHITEINGTAGNESPSDVNGS